MFNFFDDEKSILEEGLFRESVGPKEQSSLIEAMAKGQEISHKDFSSMQIAVILKKLFRELPISLLDFSMETLEPLKEKNKDERKKYIKEKLDELLISRQNSYMLAKKLFSLLNFVASRSDKNLMTSYNLAVAIGPSLGQRDQGTDLGAGLAYNKLILQFTEDIIADCEYFFGPDIFGVPLGRLVKNGRLPEALESVFDVLIKHKKEGDNTYFDPSTNCGKMDMLELMKTIEAGKAIQEMSALSALELLKAFLRKLPRRLAPLPAFDLILSMQPEQYHFVIREEIIDKLSPDAYEVFKKFISLFAEINGASSIITARLLAHNFSHALFFLPENINNDPAISAKFFEKFSIIIAELINNYSVFFNKDVEFTRNLKRVFDHCAGDINKAVEALKKSLYNPQGFHSDEHYVGLFEWVLEEEKIVSADAAHELLLMLMSEASRLVDLSKFPVLDGSQTMLKYLYERVLNSSTLSLARKTSEAGETFINSLLKVKQTNITLDILKDLFAKVGQGEVVAQAKRDHQPDAFTILFDENRPDKNTAEFEATKSFYVNFYCNSKYLNNTKLCI